MQPGNTMVLHWRARLSEHLGTYVAEPSVCRAGELIAGRTSLAGLNAFRSISEKVLPEREAHSGIFDAAEIMLDAMAKEPFDCWAPLYVRWEIGLLAALGFGLDLTQCVATGRKHNLAFVSPRTGCAVSSTAGKDYAGRLLRLPRFLLEPHNAEIGHEDILSGLRLSGYFLAKRVLEPANAVLPVARLHLDEMAQRESLRRS